MFILSPIFLFSIGTFIGLTPYIFDSKYFYSYSTFIFSNEILVVYLVGWLSFLLGTLTIKFIYKKRDIKITTIKKDFNYIIIFLIFISLIVFVKIIALYGSLPILSILAGNEGISYVNETQKDVGGGLYGVFFLMIISLIILLPYSIINKSVSKFNKYLFYLHLVLLFMYTTYSGKRQMMFILFTYTFTYLLIYYKKIGDTETVKKMKVKGLIILSILIGVFIFLGLVRANLLNEDVSLLNPIVHYASLPFMNLTDIILHQNNNSYAYSFTAFLDFTFSDLPTFVKSIFSSSFPSLPMPHIEPTSPATIYGMIFWEFGYIGVFMHLFTVGLFSSYLYNKALYSKNLLYISLYSLIVWPLLSIHTYNHFKNFMFLIIPIFMILIGSKIYKKIPKKRKTDVTQY